MPDNETKRCSRCGETKPLSEFYKNRSYKDGLTTYCKLCACEYSRQYRQANPEKVRKAKNRWRAANPEPAKERTRRWRAANPEKAREGHRRWYMANWKRCQEDSRRWCAANPEKRQKIVRRWKKANPDNIRANCQRRLAKKRALPNDLTERQWQTTLEAFENRCAYCGEPATLENCPRHGHLEQEHVIALDTGGGYTLGNIVPACERCNRVKGTRDWRGWMESKGYDTDSLQSCLEHLVA